MAMITPSCSRSRKRVRCDYVARGLYVQYIRILLELPEGGEHEVALEYSVLRWPERMQDMRAESFSTWELSGRELLSRCPIDGTSVL